MKQDYVPTRLMLIDFEFEHAILRDCDPYLTLSRKDVLGIVQSAFAELDDTDPQLIAIKQQVLEEVSEGKLAHALRTAIIGAGQRNGQAGSASDCDKVYPT